MLELPTSEIWVTWTPSCTPARASSVTVAGCPTLTLLMSDSLRETGSVIALESTISANAELDEPLDPEDDEELEEPRLPAVPVPEPPVPPPLPPEPDEELELEALELDPAETVSPGRRLDNDAIVPLEGAYSLVLSSAI